MRAFRYQTAKVAHKVQQMHLHHFKKKRGVKKCSKGALLSFCFQSQKDSALEICGPSSQKNKKIKMFNRRTSIIFNMRTVDWNSRLWLSDRV